MSIAHDTVQESGPQGFPESDGRLAQEILGALKGIRYGAVEITVHAGKVVQIDRRERFRLSPERPPTGATA